MHKGIDEFARRLGALEGQDFEDEVCAFLRKSFSDFQDVPAQPQGDAGLDGLSHGQTIAYCCYGPVQAPFKTNTVGLKAAIITKFRSDLRKLFELAAGGKKQSGKLKHCPTAGLPTVLAAGKKILTVKLVVSCFQAKDIIGAINTSFEAYKKASRCQYVDNAAGVVVLGPRALATMGAVDDLTLLRLQEREVLQRVAVAMSSAPPPALPSSDFDAKFDWIQAKAPNDASRAALTSLREHFRKRWSSTIALENDLANNAVVLHKALSTAREEAAADAAIESLYTPSPQQMITRMRAKIAERLDQQLGATFPPEIRNQLSDGELARLIGECPIDWRT